MPLLTMRQDFRAPAFGAASTARHLRAPRSSSCGGPTRTASTSSCSRSTTAIDDGWMPAPLTIAAVMLAMTERAPVLLSASILPLHDPIRIAEQIAVIDNAFPGRLWTVFGAGYRDDEFEMAGVEHARRGKILEEQIARDAAGVDRRTVRVAGPHGPRHAASPRRNRTRWCSSAAECPAAARARPRGCACR